MSSQKLKASFNGKPSQGEVDIFCSAAQEGRSKTVDKLLEKYGVGIINEKNTFRYTALMLAVDSGTNEMVEKLVKNGAIVDLEDSRLRGGTVVTAAMARGLFDTVKILGQGMTLAEHKQQQAQKLLQEKVQEKQDQAQKLASDLEKVTSIVAGGTTREMSFRKPLQFQRPNRG